jgi:putative endonuclease
VSAVRTTDAVGDYGERLAVRHLESLGYRVLERRWRCARGEIDILAVDGRCLVACEVKTRRSVAAGGPLEAVTAAKVARLRRLTAAWLQQQDASWPDVRIDVIGVRLRSRGPAEVEHVRGVG